jgi:hypothetical protein
MNELARRTRAVLRPRREPAWLLRAGVFGCALFALMLLLLTRVSAPNPTSATALIGRPAPHFVLRVAQSGKTLAAPGGYSTADGKPTLLIFFNTLCIHCLSEIGAARQAANATPGSPLDILFIDTPGENAQITGAYMARLRLNPPVLLDTGAAVSRVYHASYSPTLVLVDRHGMVRTVWIGETTAAELSAEINSAPRT